MAALEDASVVSQELVLSSRPLSPDGPVYEENMEYRVNLRHASREIFRVKDWFQLDLTVRWLLSGLRHFYSHT